MNGKVVREIESGKSNGTQSQATIKAPSSC